MENTTQDKTIQAIEDLAQKIVSTEKALEEQEKSLSLKNKEFANFIKAQKHNEEELKVLFDMVKEEMEKRGLREHLTSIMKFTLSPSGKYRLSSDTNIEDIPDELCDIKKVLNNKKITAYKELNQTLPAGVESTGNILRKELLV
jgi:hypothetical protein